MPETIGPYYPYFTFIDRTPASYTHTIATEEANHVHV